MLRFPEGMRALIKEAAEKNSRTMNAEIISRLRDSFHEEAPAPLADEAMNIIGQAVRETIAVMYEAGWAPPAAASALAPAKHSPKKPKE